MVREKLGMQASSAPTPPSIEDFQTGQKPLGFGKAVDAGLPGVDADQLTEVQKRMKEAGIVPAVSESSSVNSQAQPDTVPDNELVTEIAAKVEETLEVPKEKEGSSIPGFMSKK